MATTATIPEPTQDRAVTGTMLVSLPSLDREALVQLLANLAEAFPGENLIAATPDGAPETAPVRTVNYTPSVVAADFFTLTAADFLNTHELARQYNATSILKLGPNAQTLSLNALRGLAGAVAETGADLAVPRYDLPARAGLVNSAILYPLTRALFGPAVRFPLAIDLALSARASERLAATAQRFTAANNAGAIEWPVIEAAVAGYTITEIDAGPRTLPQPAQDLNATLAQVVGSLFTEIDLKAAFWQRARLSGPTLPMQQHPPAADAEDITPMLDAFRLAYSNLHEIWALVLPPHSLLGLKRMSNLPSENFTMPDALWARIVFDFLLAFRLRTLNRSHLMGAFTPLYLAWVASHILLTSQSAGAEQHIEAVAAAFETDKPYLVSRWRWPDRFNP